MTAVQCLITRGFKCILRPNHTNNLCLFSRKSHSYSRSGRNAAISMAFASYQMTNPQKMSNASPVVIMHGLLGSKMNWKSLSKAINQKTGRVVYTVDARNHGDSPHTDDITYPLLGEDILHFLKERNCDKAVLMGHSMGGRAVMAAALMEPSVVEKLIVLDISPLGVSGSISTLPDFVELMRKINIPPDLGMTQARAYADELLATAVRDKGIREFLLTNLVDRGSEFGWKVNIDSIADNFNPHISTFPLPDDSVFEGETAFIAGAKSDYIRPEDEEEIQEIFPAATFHYLEGVGHWLHSDKPKEFLDLVVPLLQA